jgi:alpha-1,2-mannosyltransferase
LIFFLKGLLPGHFPTSGELPNATRLVPTAQNDENREESDRYVPVQSCDFLMDLERSDHTTDDEWEPNYAKMVEKNLIKLIKI